MGRDTVLFMTVGLGDAAHSQFAVVCPLQERRNSPFVALRAVSKPRLTNGQIGELEFYFGVFVYRL